MDVTGNISVGEGITISLTVRPTDDARDHMRGHMAPDMSNQVNITLYALVEFEDLGESGFDGADAVISAYNLSDDVLGDLEHTTSGDLESYNISSEDGVFRMGVEVNTSDTSILQWKWSVMISYPFLSNSSKVAMLHSFSSSKSPRMGMHPPAQPPPTSRLGNKSMIYDNGFVPIFFSWVDTALVDGSEVGVEATAADHVFSISIPQGKDIYYDPSLGVTEEALELGDTQIEELIMEVTGNFADTIQSPTAEGLLILAAAVTAVMAIAYRRR